jgi:hypothetical protein
MFATVLQLVGLLLLLTAGILVSLPVALGAAGVACLYVGLAADKVGGG